MDERQRHRGKQSFAVQSRLLLSRELVDAGYQYTRSQLPRKVGLLGIIGKPALSDAVEDCVSANPADYSQSGKLHRTVTAIHKESDRRTDGTGEPRRPIRSNTTTLEKLLSKRSVFLNARQRRTGGRKRTE